jgi:hypothetical protein
MTTDLNDRLTRATVRVLADAAFVLCEPVASPPAYPERVLEASLSFSGPAAGSFRFAASGAGAVGFAVNLLGLEPDDPDAPARAVDATGELCNILAGAWMEAWHGAAAYQLGIPTTVETTGAEVEERWRGACWHLSFVTDEGERIDALALLDGSAP